MFKITLSHSAETEVSSDKFFENICHNDTAFYFPTKKVGISIIRNFRFVKKKFKRA